MEDTRCAAFCFLLALVILHANPTSVAADAAEVCGYRTPLLPFCTEWGCKAGCWADAKVFFGGARVQEHRCLRGGWKGVCYCLFCKKNWALDQNNHHGPELFDVQWQEEPTIPHLKN